MADINFLNNKDESQREEKKKDTLPKEVEYTHPDKETQPTRMHKQRWREFLRSFIPPKKNNVKITMEKLEKLKPEEDIWSLPKSEISKEPIKAQKEEVWKQSEIMPKAKEPAPLPKLPDFEPKKIEVQVPKVLKEEKKHESWLKTWMSKKSSAEKPDAPQPIPVFMPEIKPVPLKQKETFVKPISPRVPRMQEIQKPHKENGRMEYTTPTSSRPYKGGMNLDVNLVPADLMATLAPRDKSRSLAWVIAGSVVLILFVYSGLIIYDYQLRTKTVQVKDEIQNIDQQTKQYANLQEKALSLKKHIDATSELLEKHIYWTQFLEQLEKVTIPNVYYESISGSTGGAFTLAAFAPSFKDIAKQVRAMEAADFIESVSVTGGSVQGGNVEGAIAVGEVSEETAEESMEIEEGVQPEFVSFGINIQVKNTVFLTE